MDAKKLPWAKEVLCLFVILRFVSVAATSYEREERVVPTVEIIPYAQHLHCLVHHNGQLFTDFKMISWYMRAPYRRYQEPNSISNIKVTVNITKEHHGGDPRDTYRLSDIAFQHEDVITAIFCMAHDVRVGQISGEQSNIESKPFQLAKLQMGSFVSIGCGLNYNRLSKNLPGLPEKNDTDTVRPRKSEESRNKRASFTKGSFLLHDDNATMDSKMAKRFSEQFNEPSLGNILDGVSAEISNIPWTVAIHFDTKFLCTGAVIEPWDPRDGMIWVLTAKHCAVDEHGDLRADIDKICVKGGSNSREYGGDGVKSCAKHVHIHPSLHKDFILIELQHELYDPDITIQPVCLPTTTGDKTKYDNYDKCIIAGYGGFRSKNLHATKPLHIWPWTKPWTDQLFQPFFPERPLKPRLKERLWQSMLLLIDEYASYTMGGDSGAAWLCYRKDHPGRLYSKGSDYSGLNDQDIFRWRWEVVAIHKGGSPPEVGMFVTSVLDWIRYHQRSQELKSPPANTCMDEEIQCTNLFNYCVPKRIAKDVAEGGLLGNTTEVLNRTFVDEFRAELKRCWKDELFWEKLEDDELDKRSSSGILTSRRLFVGGVALICLNNIVGSCYFYF